MSDYATLIRPTGAHSGVVALRAEIVFPGHSGNETFLTDWRVRRKIDHGPFRVTRTSGWRRINRLGVRFFVGGKKETLEGLTMKNRFLSASVVARSAYPAGHLRSYLEQICTRFLRTICYLEVKLREPRC